MLDYQKQFIRLALDCGVLKFGEFQLKSGRLSPYFFNTGLFNTGAQLDKLGQFYAQTLLNAGVAVDVLYGPAYKGIPLVSTTSIAYSRLSRDIPFAFNRKEAKDHGEGGTLVGVVIALDRQEKGQNSMSAVQEVSQQFGIPVLSIISLAEIIEFIAQDPDFIDKLAIISHYRQQYGI